MAKAKKPNDDALQAEARSRTRDMPAETAGGRIDETAEFDDELLLGDESLPDSRPQADERSMREKMGNQPDPRPKR